MPLARTLVLVRGGGILVLGGHCTKNIYDGTKERHVLVFPTSLSSAGSSGRFTLIEDDGLTNSTAYTQIELSFAVVQVGGEEAVQVDYEIIHGAFELPYEVLWWELPQRDLRRIVGAAGKEVLQTAEGAVGLKMKV